LSRHDTWGMWERGNHAEMEMEPSLKETIPQSVIIVVVVVVVVVGDKCKG